MLSCYLKLNKQTKTTRRARELEIALAVWAALKFLHYHPCVKAAVGGRGLIPPWGTLALVLGPLADRPQGTDR